VTSHSRTSQIQSVKSVDAGAALTPAEEFTREPTVSWGQHKRRRGVEPSGDFQPSVAWNSSPVAYLPNGTTNETNNRPPGHDVAGGHRLLAVLAHHGESGQNIELPDACRDRPESSFAGTIGPDFDLKKLFATARLLDEVQNDHSVAASAAKAFFHRKFPVAAEEAVVSYREWTCDPEGKKPADRPLRS
jgi:hypothetical protein